MLTDAVSFAALPAADLDRARQWYADKLDLRPADGNEGALRFETGKGTGFLLYSSSFAGTNQATAMGWMVDDLPAEMTDLRSRGVVFEEYDMPGLKTENGMVTMPDGSGRSAWFKDSEGNILALNDEG